MAGNPFAKKGANAKKIAGSKKMGKC